MNEAQSQGSRSPDEIDLKIWSYYKKYEIMHFENGKQKGEIEVNSYFWKKRFV